MARRRILLFIVISACTNGDEFYIIDSVWTSDKKAQKRCNTLNEKGSEWLMEEYGCGLFEVRQKFISK